VSNPNCCGEVIKNSANNLEFYYCRGCKQEVEYTKLNSSIEKWFGPKIATQADVLKDELSMLPLELPEDIFFTIRSHITTSEQMELFFRDKIYD
jgi:hypothetical protein